MVQSILVIRRDRIGDLVVSTAAIHALRTRFPADEIVVLTSTLNRSILIGNPDVSAIWTLTPKNAWFVLPRIFFKKWDIAIDLNPAGSKSSGFVTWLSRARQRISFERHRLRSKIFYNVRLPHDPHNHHAHETMKAATYLGADISDVRYYVYPSLHEETVAENTLRSVGWTQGETWIAVHPGNIKKFDARWPEDKFADLIDLVLRQGAAKVLLIEGPGEHPLTQAIEQRLKVRLPVVSGLSLLALAAVLKRVQVVVCNSTGTLHLAAAVQTPTLSLLKPQDYPLWRPLSPQHVALIGKQPNSCRDIPVEDAWVALQGMLAKQPSHH